MLDRVMIVKCFEFCRVEDKCSVDCPYWDNDGCTKELANDVLTLLKEHEQKTGHWIQSNPKFVSAKATGGSRMSTCSSCGKWGRKSFSFCPHCGAKMKGR